MRIISVNTYKPPLCFHLEGIVRVEQKNDSFIERGIFDDGPYEAGDENQKNPDLVPVPASSYLGKNYNLTVIPVIRFIQRHIF